MGLPTTKRAGRKRDGLGDASLAVGRTDAQEPGARHGQQQRAGRPGTRLKSSGARNVSREGFSDKERAVRRGDGWDGWHWFCVAYVRIWSLSEVRFAQGWTWTCQWASVCAHSLLSRMIPCHALRRGGVWRSVSTEERCPGMETRAGLLRTGLRGLNWSDQRRGQRPKARSQQLGVYKCREAHVRRVHTRAHTHGQTPPPAPRTRTRTRPQVGWLVSRLAVRPKQRMDGSMSTMDRTDSSRCLSVSGGCLHVLSLGGIDDRA